MAYDLEGTLLQACSCPAPCPRWIGADTSGGPSGPLGLRPCDSVNAYHFDRGTIRGVEVSGLVAVLVVRLARNLAAPSTGRVVRFIDDGASDKQTAAILDAYRGQLGGPLADLAKLVGEELAVERVAIVDEIRCEANVQIADVVNIAMAPLAARTDARTTLRDSLLASVPLSSASLGRADHYSVNLPQYGMVWSFEGRNAVHAQFHISHSAGA